MHKTSARPMVWAYVSLIVYASLYPFADWRLQGVMPWDFLWAPLPQYWSGFDLVSNTLGYMPLGFLLVIARTREGRGLHAVGRAMASVAVISLSMEAAQVYLPSRVPSNVDLLLNIVGGAAGAFFSRYLLARGVIDRWVDVRQRWFSKDGRAELVLLVLWPLALLFPVSVPLGLGQVYGRLGSWVADWLADSPLINWAPAQAIGVDFISPQQVAVVVAMGSLIPILLAYLVIGNAQRRIWSASVIWSVGILANTLSGLLDAGFASAWTWLGPLEVVGLATSLALAVLMARIPPIHAARVLCIVLVGYLILINRMPASTYFQLTLDSWEQGRFSRFHGAAQWLGWLWPYAVLTCAVMRGFIRQSKIDE